MDAAKIAELGKAGYKDRHARLLGLGKFKREIDMSTDPRMYGFAKDKYELILSFNPRNAPEFVQDRLGWSGEGSPTRSTWSSTGQSATCGCSARA
jgi:hypothetical protein